MYIAKHDCGNYRRVELGTENMLPHTRYAEQGIAKLKVVLQDVVKKGDAGVGRREFGVERWQAASGILGKPWEKTSRTSRSTLKGMILVELPGV